ncbi:MAG TPA: AtpZ/AtpI family protein [Thermoflexales bacterium]|nr:AtpZ/AtpI family protein [Thermoflexales bacterium]
MKKENPLVIMSKAFPPSVVAMMMMQILLVVGGVIIGAIVLGLALDARFGTRPLLTLGLGVISLPVAVFLTYWLAMRSAKKSRQAYLNWVDETARESQPNQTEEKQSEI